ncbi:phosphate transporter (Pho88) [Conglomerata obtusa]
MSVSMVALDQGINIASTFILMQFLKRIDQTNTDFLFYLRITYICTQLLNFMFIYILKNRIQDKNDTRTIKIKKQRGFFEPADDNEDDEEVEMTYCEYDMKEYVKIMRSSLLQTVVICLSHYKWKICQPLIVQCIGPFKSLILNPLFVCYLRGKEILRPYELNMLFQKIDVPVAEKKKKED